MRRARRYARRNGLEWRFEPSEGKGSHGTFHLGTRRTGVQHGEIVHGRSVDSQGNDMATTLKPGTEARIADLAKRLGFAGPGAAERVLEKALDDLEAKAPPPRRKMTPEEIEADVAYWSTVAKRNRALYPFDDDHPPSKVWQDELYDEQGLPK